MKKDQHRAETKAVRGGTDLQKKNGPLATPIYQTSTFEVEDNEEQLRVTPTDMFYTRYGNPTVTGGGKGDRGTGRDGAGAGVCFGNVRDYYTDSGAAEEWGPRCGAAGHLRRARRSFWGSGCRRLGIETTFVDTTEYEQYERAIRPNTGCCIWSRRRIPCCE